MGLSLYTHLPPASLYFYFYCETPQQWVSLIILPSLHNVYLFAIPTALPWPLSRRRCGRLRNASLKPFLRNMQ